MKRIKQLIFMVIAFLPFTAVTVRAESAKINLNVNSSNSDVEPGEGSEAPSIT